MKNMKQTLTQSIPETPFRLWHVLAILFLFWIGPIFLPEMIIANYALVIGVVWLVSYFAMNRLIKRTVRVAKPDIILIERFFILLTFLVPAIIATSHGLRRGFDTFTVVGCVFMWSISFILVFGIALHIKNADKYYHGVKKDELFK